MNTCSTPKCYQRTYDVETLCWYHGRLMAGLISPYDPGLYPEATRKSIERAEVARLEAEIAGIEAAG